MIRLAKPGDEPALANLMMDAGLASEGTDYSQWSQPTLVYIVDNKIVGMIQALLGRPVAAILDVAVHPDYQNQGIARKLWDALELIMESHGVSVYMGWTHEKNKRVISAFEARGMQYTGEVLRYMRKL